MAHITRTLTPSGRLVTRWLFLETNTLSLSFDQLGTLAYLQCVSDYLPNPSQTCLQEKENIVAVSHFLVSDLQSKMLNYITLLRTHCCS